MEEEEEAERGRGARELRRRRTEATSQVEEQRCPPDLTWATSRVEVIS